MYFHCSNIGFLSSATYLVSQAGRIVPSVYKSRRDVEHHVSPAVDPVLAFSILLSLPRLPSGHPHLHWILSIHAIFFSSWGFEI